jgi:hypothetical protein
LRLSPRRFPKSRFVAGMTDVERVEYLVLADACDLLEVALQRLTDETRSVRQMFVRPAIVIRRRSR